MTDRNTKIPGSQIKDGSLTKNELSITNTPTNGQILKVNMPAGDFTAIDLPGSSLPTDLNISGQTAQDTIFFNGSNWVAIGGSEKIKMGIFTRDLSSQGDQAITGIGFKPSFIQVIASVSANDGSHCWGYAHGSDANYNLCMRIDLYNNRPDRLIYDGSLIRIDTAVATEVKGVLKSFDSDGFTITWSHIVGSPSGTADILYTVFR